MGFWDKHAGGRPAAPQPRRDIPPMPGAWPVPTPAEPRYEQRYEPQQEEYAPAKATASKKAGICPECGSGNYGRLTATTNERCFDCGYPIQQSGSGVSTEGANLPTHRARQVQGSGYQPQTIIGRVEG